MNHLAHFVLAGPEPPMIVGSFLGDYVKGRLYSRFDPGVERGIRLHRAIDAFTDSHDIVRRSQQRFDPRFRRYAGIMTDIVYDYLLARDFENYVAQPLERFSNGVLSVLVAHSDLLTTEAAAAAYRMHANNSLARYGTHAFVERSFTYLGNRLSRDNPLDEAFTECRAHLDDLALDLSEFYPVLADYCENWRESGENFL